MTGISSSGTGALKVDNDLYKLVYFAFGFEAINNQYDRDLLMGRIIEWLDITPSDIAILSPLNNSWHGNNSIWLNTTTNENATCAYSLISCSCTSYGGGGGCGCGSSPPQNMNMTGDILHSQLITDLSDTINNESHSEWYRLSIDCTDNAGNSNDTSTEFYIDTTLPSIISQMPGDGQHILGTNSEEFSINYTEENLKEIELFWNGTWPYACENIIECPSITIEGCDSGIEQICSVNLDLSNYSEGDKIEYYFGLSDSVNSIYLEPYTLEIDRRPPEIIIESPLNQSYNTGRLHYNITVNEPLANAFVSIDDGKNYTLENDTPTHYYETQLILDYPDSGIEQHSATFWVNDTAGNQNSSTVHFTVDMITLEITAHSPQNITYSSLSVPLNVSIEETGNCSYSLNNGTNTTLFSDNITGETMIYAGKGSNLLTVYCTSEAGSKSGNERIAFAVANVSHKSRVNITENETAVINITNETDTVLELMTRANLTDIDINVTEYDENPGTNGTIALANLSRYIEIEAGQELLDNMTWAIIKVYYTDEEVEAAGIDESSLRLYYWNESSSTWEEMPDSGVNTTANYVWANTTHFSIYGVYGEMSPYCGDGTCNAGESCSSCHQDCGSCPSGDDTGGSGGGGGGGGGGFTTSSCTENWTCASWSTCINGQQTRACTDQNECGTTKNKPNETQDCVAPIPEPTQVCIPDEARCSDNDLQRCNADGTEWETLETCEYGCSGNECNTSPTILEEAENKTSAGPEPEGGAVTGLILGVEPFMLAGIIGIVIVLVCGLVYWFRFRKSVSIPNM